MEDAQTFRIIIEATTRNALMRFVAHFGRKPTEAEATILADAIASYFGIANPTQQRTH